MSAIAAIPPIIHRRGHLWYQPERDAIEIDGTSALMSRATFEQLRVSQEPPSAVYQGKMWRRLNVGPIPTWSLCWFAPADSQGKYAVEEREIVLV